LTRLSAGLYPESVCVVCAPGGSRKSFFVLQCLLFWHRECVPFACYMLEQVRDWHLTRLNAQMSNDRRLLDRKFMMCPDNHAYARSERDKHLDDIAEIGKSLHVCPDGELMTLKAMADWIDRQAVAGKRVIVIDPVTNVDPQGKIWEEERRFITRIKHTATQYACTVLLVTHPKQGASKQFTMDSLAGSATYQQNTQCILWIKSYLDNKPLVIDSPYCRDLQECSGVFTILKTNNGRGVGRSVGFYWDVTSMQWVERGLVVEDKK